MKNSYQEDTAFPPHGQMPVGHVVGRGRASAQNKQAEMCSVQREKSLRASDPRSPQATVESFTSLCPLH